MSTFNKSLPTYLDFCRTVWSCYWSANSGYVKESQYLLVMHTLNVTKRFSYLELINNKDHYNLIKTSFECCRESEIPEVVEAISKFIKDVDERMEHMYD